MPEDKPENKPLNLGGMAAGPKPPTSSVPHNVALPPTGAPLPVVPPAKSTFTNPLAPKVIVEVGHAVTPVPSGNIEKWETKDGKPPRYEAGSLTPVNAK